MRYVVGVEIDHPLDATVDFMDPVLVLTLVEDEVADQDAAEVHAIPERLATALQA